VFVDTAAMSVRALTQIRPGDGLDYFYPSTEWSMNEPFVCECQARTCLGFVAGAAHLPAESLARYQLNEHVARLLRARNTLRRRVSKRVSRLAAS
jgi:hypothetical protein